MPSQAVDVAQQSHGAIVASHGGLAGCSCWRLCWRCAGARRVAAARARALRLQAAARRQDRMLHADRAGEPRPAARAARCASRWPSSRPSAPLAADPVIYLAGGPGDAPLVASTAGADPLAEGDWWNDTAVIRRRRDVIIVSQRGAGGSTPNLDCFEPRTTEPGARPPPRRHRAAGARHPAALPRRASTSARSTWRCTATPALADDVADLVTAAAARQDQSLRHLLRHALGASR